MATWNDVVDYVKKNCRGTLNDNGLLEADPVFQDGRSQIVWLHEIKLDEDDIWVEIDSPVGKLELKDVDTALAMLGKEGLCGGLIKSGEAYFVKHCMPIADLSIEELVRPMRYVALAADKLEKHFFNEDKL